MVLLFSQGATRYIATAATKRLLGMGSAFVQVAAHQAEARKPSHWVMRFLEGQQGSDHKDRRVRRLLGRMEEHGYQRKIAEHVSRC